MNTILYENWRSSSSWRVRWALRIKQVPYEAIQIDLRAGAQHEPAHRARNPLGYVPTLEIDGRFLGESVAILEFLDERFPDPPLYPRDPWLRARVRQCVELVNSGIQPFQNLSILHHHSEDPEAQKAWGHHFNARGLEAMERLLVTIDAESGVAESGPGRFTVGDSLTAADLYLVPQVASARRFGVDVSRFPRVRSAESAALSTEHAAAALPDNHPARK